MAMTGRKSRLAADLGRSSWPKPNLGSWQSRLDHRSTRRCWRRSHALLSSLAGNSFTRSGASTAVSVSFRGFGGLRWRLTQPSANGTLTVKAYRDQAFGTEQSRA